MPDATNSSETTPGWTVVYSIAMELDVALSVVGGYFADLWLTEDVGQVVQSVPPDWLAEWSLLLGTQGRLVSVLEQLAILAGVLDGGDYSTATLAMRELTLADAWTRLAAYAEPLGLPLPNDRPTDQLLANLAVDIQLCLYGQVNLTPTAEAAYTRSLREEFLRLTRFLHDGALHARFWHWLDRFYYETYRPWRDQQLEAMTALEEHACLMLGARQKRGAPPDMAWLPAQNPLRVHPELQSAVATGRLHVLFWVEPFGLADLVSLAPGSLIVSFARPGLAYQNFQAFGENLALRLKALADPTRLTILRLIRHFGMMNTEIANFLEIARPTVSVHAKILREAGLIKSHQQGREVRHEIIPTEVRRLFHDLERFLDLPDG